MDFAVQQEAFSGPLGLLLDLIEQEKLDITQVSLAKVAEEYLQSLEEREVPAEELADFLLVAARLIYLKSRTLMPYLKVEEEEEAVDRLQDQLRLYKEYATAAEKIAGSYLVNKMYVRPFVRPTATKEPTFLPATNIATGAFKDTFTNILKRLQPFLALQEASMERTKSVEERLEELTEALRSRATMSFKEVVRGASTKMEVVVSFLALLELLRRRVIRASQGTAFDDIQLHRLK